MRSGSFARLSGSGEVQTQGSLRGEPIKSQVSIADLQSAATVENASTQQLQQAMMGQTPSVAFLRKYAESNKDLLVSHALRERNRSVMSTY